MLNRVPVKWAQRESCVYLTVAAPAAYTLHQVSPTRISISDKDGQCIVPELDMYAAVSIPNGCSFGTMSGASTRFSIGKAVVDWWPRLTSMKHTVAPVSIACDWNMWVDEDEDDEENGVFANGFDAGDNVADSGDEDDEEYADDNESADDQDDDDV